MASLPIHPGHEALAFVQPSSFLKRSRQQSHPPAPMPAAAGEKGLENAVDRDQRIGLVRLFSFLFFSLSFTETPRTTHYETVIVMEFLETSVNGHSC